ncbi:MAG: hypothetical protein MUE70_04165 [Desulfobacterales bacterium]|nr:hypothetical protein [Desulfobacterales bacterium]
MKTNYVKKVVICACMIGAVLGIFGIAHATWSFSHGNVTVIEYPANCDSYIYRGWGLDFQNKSGIGNWIHMTIPTPIDDDGNAYARYFRLKFYTGSVDAWIDRIDIYNGNTKVKTLTGLSLSNGWKDLKFDMGANYNFKRGMGLSIHINNGVEMMSHRYIFSSAGADFQ